MPYDLVDQPQGDLPRPPRGNFRGDFATTIRLCLRTPLLLATTITLAVIVEIPNALATTRASNTAAGATWLLEFALVGFFGTQRIWLLRAGTGDRYPLAEAVNTTVAFFPRFARLALILAGILSLFVVIMERVAHLPHTTWPIHLAVILFVYALDVVLAFVVPELTFRTSSVRQAWAAGKRATKSTWPNSKWYLLSPGLAVLVPLELFSNALPDHGRGWLALVVASLSAVLSLLFRGTVLRYYSRLLPEAVQDAAGIRAAR